MKKLPEIFKKNGFTFQQVERTDVAAIYRQILNNRTVAFEVISVLVAPRAERWGKVFEAREVYPGTNRFGTLAWSISVINSEDNSLKRAYEKYNLLNQNNGKKTNPN